METKTPEKNSESFLSPKIIENYSMLKDLGVFKQIESLESSIQNYKNLLAGAMEIFNKTTIDEIMDASVWQISDRLLPSYIVFIWKPLQNRDDVTMKCYKNYKLVDINLNIERIDDFEPFFRKHPEPVDYKYFVSKTGNNEKIKIFNSIEPGLIIPILGPSGLYGLVLLGSKILGSDYVQADFLFIKNLMSFVSNAIQNHLHYERTLRDIKTGLYNNSFFMNRLNEEIIRSKRINSWTSIIIVDVDRFKKFNDQYGHLAGDRVLETLAITIKQGVRGGDVPSRFGGEEFTILLPDTDKEEAWLVAERLRTMVSQMMVAWEPPVSKITISLGIITFNKEMNMTAEEVMRRADEALYISKEMGRDCTSAWNAGLLNKIQQKKL